MPSCRFGGAAGGSTGADIVQVEAAMSAGLDSGRSLRWGTSVALKQPH